MTGGLNLRLPLGGILPRPELSRSIVVQDSAVRSIAFNGLTHAVGDVAKVAEQRALVTFFDFTMKSASIAATDTRQEIIEVGGVTCVRFGDFMNESIGAIKDSIGTGLHQLECSLRTVERHEARAVFVAT